MTPKTLENSHFWQKGSTFMARPSLAEKDILNPSEAIDYFVLSRRKFYDLLKIRVEWISWHTTENAS